MVKVLSNEEHAVLLAHSERFQHLRRDPRVIAALGVSHANGVDRLVDAEIKTIKSLAHPEDFEK